MKIMNSFFTIFFSFLEQKPWNNWNEDDLRWTKRLEGS